ncbi:hypothetical protein HanHA300_Chr01g0005701 [Helianthus annuus]|nr:hypothetical protein HanHA300_Chr01g0005701 [Helianthus annuus]
MLFFKFIIIIFFGLTERHLPAHCNKALDNDTELQRHVAVVLSTRLRAKNCTFGGKYYSLVTLL